MKRLFQFFYYPGPSQPGFYRVRNPNDEPNVLDVLPRRAYYQCFGVLFNWKACWIGAHYSKRDKRLCVNLVPCLTIWWAQPGGNTP